MLSGRMWLQDEYRPIGEDVGRPEIAHQGAIARSED